MASLIKVSGLFGAEPVGQNCIGMSVTFLHVVLKAGVVVSRPRVPQFKATRAIS